MRDESSSIERVIAVLEAQRSVLGDEAVDFAISALRARASPIPPVDATSATRLTGAARGGPDAPPPSRAKPKLRQVSVLFCDIVESTSILGRVSAEDAALILGEPLTRFASIVAQAGGRVLRFTGDGLKAAFGTERTHEDDAERAVRAGLTILDASHAHRARISRALGIADFAVRVGINTGPVLIGAGPEADNAAMGHAVHIAARLEQSAPPGRLRISDATWRLVRGRFEVESPSFLAVKGSDEPIRTRLVVREISSRERGIHPGVEGVRPPLTGRITEVAALVAATVRARETGRAQIATVIGDAGLGKSRLAFELAERLPAEVPVIRARGQEQTALQPYGLLRELVTRWAGITDDEPMSSACARLAERLAPLFDADGEAQAQCIGQLIGLDFSGSPLVAGIKGRALREKGFAALHLALDRVARDAALGPLVLLVDDLHWVDDGSLDFLEQLGDREAPLSLIVLGRPSLTERRPGWAGKVYSQTTIALGPLGDEDARELATALLARLVDAPDHLRDRLVARAHGNPFFLEELVRMLIDDGTIVVDGAGWHFRGDHAALARLPETLVGVLQARLDALPAAELAALQRASILGQVFWDEALATLDEDAGVTLPSLIARSLVVPRAESSFDGCAELRFFHPLLHEVTYGTVLKAPRRAGHALAARWLAARVGERAGEFLGLTAEHFERAGESAEALEYFERASQDSIRRFAYPAAWAYTQRQLAQPSLASDPERHYWTLSQLQMIADYQDDRAGVERAMADMQAVVDASGSDRFRASLLAVRCMHADRDGRKGDSKALGREALELAERCGAESAGALASGVLAWLAVEERDFATVEHHVEAGIRWARKSAALPKHRGGYGGYEVPLRIIRIESLIAQERIADAATEIDHTLGILTSGEPSDRHQLLLRRGRMHFELGDLASAVRTGEESLTLAREIGRTRYQVSSLQLLAEVFEAADDQARAHSAAAQAVRLARECHASDELQAVLALEGSASAQLGDLARGRDLLDAVLALARAERDVAGRRDALARLAVVDLRSGDVARALERAEELLADQDDRFTHPPRVLHVVWQVLRTAGDHRAAQVLDELRTRLERLLGQLPEPSERARLVSVLPHWRDIHRVSLQGSELAEVPTSLPGAPSP